MKQLTNVFSLIGALTFLVFGCHSASKFSKQSIDVGASFLKEKSQIKTIVGAYVEDSDFIEKIPTINTPLTKSQYIIDDLEYQIIPYTSKKETFLNDQLLTLQIYNQDELTDSTVIYKSQIKDANYFGKRFYLTDNDLYVLDFVNVEEGVFSNSWRHYRIKKSGTLMQIDSLFAQEDPTDLNGLDDENLDIYID